jgi:flagellar basal body-associated protein FliL
MHTSHTSRGFSIVEGILIFVILGIVVALGVTFYNVASKKTASTDSSQTSDAATVPAVTSTSDLDTVTTDLDSLDIDDADDATTLESQQAAF